MKKSDVQEVNRGGQIGGCYWNQKALGAFPHPGHYLEWSKIKNVWPYMTKGYSSAIRSIDYKIPTCVLIEYE